MRPILQRARAATASRSASVVGVGRRRRGQLRRDEGDEAAPSRPRQTRSAAKPEPATIRAELRAGAAGVVEARLEPRSARSGRPASSPGRPSRAARPIRVERYLRRGRQSGIAEPSRAQLRVRGRCARPASASRHCGASGSDPSAARPATAASRGGRSNRLAQSAGAAAVGPLNRNESTDSPAGSPARRSPRRGNRRPRDACPRPDRAHSRARPSAGTDARTADHRAEAPRLRMRERPMDRQPLVGVEQPR